MPQGIAKIGQGRGTQKQMQIVTSFFGVIIKSINTKGGSMNGVKNNKD